MNKFTLKTRLESLFIYPVSYQRVEKEKDAGPEARARRGGGKCCYWYWQPFQQPRLLRHINYKNALPKKTKWGRGAEEKRERQEHRTKQKKEKVTKEGRVGNSPGSQPWAHHHRQFETSHSNLFFKVIGGSLSWSLLPWIFWGAAILGNYQNPTC